MEISQEDLDYIDKMFDQMDINQDGGISISELAKGKHFFFINIILSFLFFLAMAASGKKPINSEIQKFFKEADSIYND